MTNVLRPLPADQFVQLAGQSGLNVSSEDLEQLARRRLLTPFDTGSYSRLHLYVLALYFDAVRTERHPWAMRSSSRSLEDVKTTSVTVHEIAQKLESAQFTSGLSDDISQLARDIEEFLATIDPFGPIAGVIDVVRRDILDQLRGNGRLFAELRATATSLAVRGDELNESLLDPQTREVPEEEANGSGHYPLGDLSGLTDGIVDASGGFAALQPTPPTREVELPDIAELSEISAPESVELDPNDADLDDESVDDDPQDNAKAAAVAIALALEDEISNVVDEVVLSTEIELPLNIDLDEESDADLAAPAEDVEEKAEDLDEGSDLDEDSEDLDEDSEDLSEEDDDDSEDLDEDLSEEDDDEDSEDLDEDLSAEDDDEDSEDLSEDEDEDVDDEDEDDEDNVEDEEDEEVVAAVTASPTDDTGEIEPPGLGEDSEDFRTTTEIEAVSRDDRPNPFAREPSTGRTQALLERLEAIKAQKSDVDEDAPANEDSLESKVRALNERREQLIREQDWAGLVQLYENQIDLFEEPADRHQVLLTLATLYELKALDHDRAFECFSLAYDLGVGQKKTLDSLRKIGSRPESIHTYIQWLEQRASAERDDALRHELQRDLVQAYRTAGQEQRAFLSFAAYLAEAPDLADTETLDLLDDLSISVDDDELADFFTDVLGRATTAEARLLLGHRAGSFFQSCGRLDDATTAYRIAFEADPSAELAFSKLTTLYERNSAWPEMRSLLAERMKTADEEEAARLRRELARVVRNENLSTNLLDESATALQADPNDTVALEQLLQAYAMENRSIDAYAHLNRLLEAPVDAPQEVRIRRELAQLALDHLDVPEEASHHLSAALALAGANPDPELITSLARVQLSTGEWAEAVETLRRLTSEIELTGESMRRWLTTGVEAARKADQPDDVHHFQERLNQLRND